MWFHLPIEAVLGMREKDVYNHTGKRVSRQGTVAWVRSGFARVNWDDGTKSDEWATDLVWH